MALVVIGGVAAGMSAASRARRIDPKLPITVLEKGPVISYGACGLPYFVEGRVRDAKQLIVYTPEYFRKERNIEVRTGARVVSISHSRREVQLESGDRVPYERLVIATGARCDNLGIAGIEQPHVFTLQTIDDAERMRRFLRERRPKRAVVIGAGYIGVEAADALRRQGLHVTIVDRSEHALARDDPPFTDAVRKVLEAHGVELRCGVGVKAIEPGQVAGVPCDMVVLAAGMKPNVELAREAGVEIGRTGAIRTDDRMETSLRGVYAAGDCAEVTHLVTGRPAYIPLGTTANKAGRVAGANAAGGRERLAGIVGTSIVGVFGKSQVGRRYMRLCNSAPAPRQRLRLAQLTRTEDLRRNIDTAGKHQVEGTLHYLAPSRLRDEAQSTVIQCPQHIGAIWKAGEDDNRDAGVTLAHLREERQPVTVRQTQIEQDQDDVGLIGEQLHRLGRVRRLEHRGVRLQFLEEATQGVADQHMVIDDKDLHRNVPSRPMAPRSARPIVRRCTIAR